MSGSWALGIILICPAEPVEPSLMMRRYWGHGRVEQGCPNLPAVVDRRSLMPITASTVLAGFNSAYIYGSHEHEYSVLRDVHTYWLLAVSSWHSTSFNTAPHAPTPPL